MPPQQPPRSPRPFTILDEGRMWAGEASLDGQRLWLRPDALRAAIGWTLKSEGLCLDEVCIPVAVHPELTADGYINLNALAEVLDRPLVVDPEAGAAYLGASAGQRADRLASLEAPEFALPDLAGKLHRLSDQRGRKVLLVAYASW